MTIVIENIAQRPKALLLGDPQNLTETQDARRATATGKVTGPDGLPAEFLKLGLVGEPLEILHHFQHHRCGVDIWRSAERVEIRHHHDATQKRIGPSAITMVESHL